MGREGGNGEADPPVGAGVPEAQAVGVPDELVAAAGDDLVHPGQSPLYHAENAHRYERQELIRVYEGTFECRLVVVADMIFPYSMSLFEDLIYDADPGQDLHLMLSSPGGDGETAVRLVRSAQARCKELTVIVPDQAKSAGTILTLGAHHILMGPTSDLGPIDPQMQMPDGKLIAAKDIIAAVTAAEEAVQASPETYTIHAALLSDVNALMVQQARSALLRSSEIMVEALSSNPDRSPEDVAQLVGSLTPTLITEPHSHGAILGVKQAAEIGFPVVAADPSSSQWQLLWRLWTKYFVLSQRFYEGARASKMIPWPPG